MTHPPPDDARDLAELAYSLSLRALGQQEAALTELRARTGTLLAAAALVASFLGGTAIMRDGFEVWTAFALAGFVASTVLAVRVLLPQESLVFAVRGSVVYEREAADETAGIAETYRRLAYWLEAFHDGNAPRAARLVIFFRLAVLALLLEIAAWTVQLAVR